jgi:hypothetical protein
VISFDKQLVLQRAFSFSLTDFFLACAFLYVLPSLGLLILVSLLFVCVRSLCFLLRSFVRIFISLVYMLISLLDYFCFDD